MRLVHSLCNEINYANKGVHALYSHCQTAIHKQSLSSQSVAQLLKVNTPQPATVLAVMAEHSIPLSKAPVLLELSQMLAQDPAALRSMKLLRTAATYKMVYGLGHTFVEKTILNLRQCPFSLNVDEATCTSNKKVLAMLVSYFNEEQNDVVVEHLGSIEVLKVDAASLEKAMVNFFMEKGIPWSNLVSIMLDSCNVIHGSKSGLETRIRQKYCPTLLDIDGDSCHHIHNAARKFAGPFESYLEGLFTDIHTDYQWASDQVMFLKEIGEHMGIPATSPQRFVPHRWLSAYDVRMQAKMMLPLYRVLYYGFMAQHDQALYIDILEKLYRDHGVSEKSQKRIKEIHLDLCKKGMTDLGKKRKARVVQKIWFEIQKVDLHLSVYLAVLPILKEYVMVFQGSQTMVHKLHDKQLEVFMNFLACFVQPEYIDMSPIKLSELDLASKTIYSQAYVGRVAEDLILAHPKHPVTVDFLEKVKVAYVTCGSYMQTKLPLKSSTLQALSSVDPVVRGHSQAVQELQKLAGMLRHLLPKDADVTREIVRYNMDPTLARYDRDNIVQWWAQVITTEKYPNLTKVIRGALSIFHGPVVESSFSLMGDVIDEKHCSMNIWTFDSIQTVKYYLKARGAVATKLFKRDDVKMGPVDKIMCKNMRDAGRKDKEEREGKMVARQNRLKDFDCSTSCGGTQTSKTTAIALEKRARLRHAAKQKNATKHKALHKLQEMAKKRKKKE